MPARIQPIPDRVFPATCGLCRRWRTLCAVVYLRGKLDRSWYTGNRAVVCTACRILHEGRWTVEEAPETPAPDIREPRVRQLGKGLRARSPSKHGLPFTF